MVLFKQEGHVENEFGGFNWVLKIEQMNDGYHVTVDTLSSLGANCIFNETYVIIDAERISTDLCRQHLEEIDEEIKWEEVREVKEVKRMRDLQELTGQESGIIIYGNEGILCNWSSIDGLPRMFGGSLIGMGEDIPEVEGEHLEDLSGILGDININICANYNDEELPKSGTVYQITEDIIVIAPDGWC